MSEVLRSELDFPSEPNQIVQVASNVELVRLGIPDFSALLYKPPFFEDVQAFLDSFIVKVC
jgi:hypothetical protein